jgi:transglutaminase-like putative cysteine protease
MLEQMADDRSLMNRARLEIDPYRNLQFEVQLRSTNSEGIPIPGDLQFLSASRNFVRREDGTIRISEEAPLTTSVEGMIRIPEPGLTPTKAKLDVPGVYSSRPNSLPDRVRLLAESITQGITGDYEKAIAIKRAIGQRVEYSLDAPPVPAGADPAEFFLFESKVGYCDLYATAMVVMARSVGLPTRYVTGYYPALGIRDRDRRWVLHESEAHAWAEIYFEGQGWVPFDATDGAIHVGDPTADEPWMERGWFRATVFTIGGLFLVLAPFGIAYAVGKRRAPKDRIRSELGKSYEKFISGLEKKTGKPKRPSQTPQEYVDGVADLITQGRAEAEALNAKFIDAMYSPNSVDDAVLGSLRSDLAATLRAVSGK